ncbi:MAG: DUF305 domain-containing protein [Terriglobales bacterium]|jgi:uncharacterized protein (DUF305 family)
MKSRSRFAVLSAFVFSSAWYANPQGANVQNGNAAPTSSWNDLIKSTTNMHSAMALVKPSGNTDADFVALMMAHHQAAIEMAKTELMYGQDAQMRRLAQEIITDQQSEIELMQLWLKQHTPEK